MDIESDKPELLVTLEEWIVARRKESVQFQYWYTTMVLEFLMLMLVASFRARPILTLYVSALAQICPWMFALDHTHYARWLPVFVHSLQELPTKHPSVWKEFQKGNFISRRTKPSFSSISDDQMHEQNNKIVKTDGGPLRLYDNPCALLKWMVSAPEVSRILQEFEVSSNIAHVHEDQKHHEDTHAFKKRFEKDVAKVLDVFQTCGNPFEERNALVSLINKRVMNAAVKHSVKMADVIGQQQYSVYVQERLVECRVSVHNTIKRNNLQLFREKKSAQNKPRAKLLSTREYCSLFSRLFIASQTREVDLEEFFAHENKKYPPSVSEFDDLRNGKKPILWSALNHMEILAHIFHLSRQ